MGYYLRVLTPSEKIIPASEIAAAVGSASLTLEAGIDRDWDQLLLAHRDGREIALIERNVVAEGSLGADEIEEFLEEIEDAEPASGVDWLRGYLPKVKVVYAFQVLNGVHEDDGWDRLDAAKELLWQRLGGVLQADNEGFSNEAGYHIVWQFADDVTGPCNMGLLKNGAWQHFEMDLGCERQREQFLNDKLPAEAKLIEA